MSPATLRTLAMQACSTPLVDAEMSLDIYADELESAGVQLDVATDITRLQSAHDHIVQTYRWGGPCAYCGEPSEGNHSIHRDGFGDGPEVPLCDKHGSHETPTEREIWARIGRAEVCIACDFEIRHDDDRRGSFHSWCYRITHE